MTYLINGEISLIEKEVIDIINKYHINNTSIIKYDLLETSIYDVIDDINTLNIFLEKKLIVAYHFTKLDEYLEKYLNNPNDNILILGSSNLKKDVLNKLKELKVTIIDTSNIDINSYIKEELKEYEINNLTINLIKDLCDNDFYRIRNEIDKLKMYAYDTKQIKYDDVKKIIKKSLNSNIFNLINAINRKKSDDKFNLYYELIRNNEDEIKIISTLANNYRLLYKVKELMKIKDDVELIKLLGIKSARLKILKMQSYNYTDLEILHILKELSMTDIKIKSGKLDKKIATELLISRL